MERFIKNFVFALFSLIPSLLIFLPLQWVSLTASATDSSFLYEGELLDSSNTALTGTYNLTTRILSPDEACLLWEDNYSNVSVTNGIFTISLPSGTNTYIATLSGGSATFDKIFYNSFSSFIGKKVTDSTPCTYSPTVNDIRKISVSVYNTSDQFLISDSFSLGSVPFAIQAQNSNQLSGHSIQEILKISDTNNTAAPILSSEWDKLISIAQGQSSSELNLNNQKISNVGTPITTTDAATKGYVDTQISSISSGVTSVGLAMPAELTITNSPVTSSGTLTGTWASQVAKKVLAAPQGATGTPGFRLLNIADIQSVNIGDFLTGTTCSAGQALTYSAISDTISCNAITLAVTNTASLANTKIWVGDVGGKAQEVAVSNDATLAADGALTLASVGTAGTYTKVTVDAKGRVTVGSSLAESDIPSLNWSKITSGKPITLNGYGITDSVQNAGSVPSVQAGAFASRPAAGTAGRIYLDTTNYVLYQDDGATWQGIGTAGSVTSVTASPPLASTGGATTPTISLTGVVDAAHGGTGLTSLTSGSLLVGNGTGTVNFLAPGANGNVMYGTGGSTWASGTPDTAGLMDKISAQTIAGAKTFSNAVTVNNTLTTSSFKVTGGSPAVGKVLTSDATGNATWGTPTGSGTVTSVGLSLPAELTITSPPVTGSGTLTGTWASQAAKKVLAAPQGAAGTPGFRLLNIADIQSVITGNFLTGSSCSTGQALTYSAISDTISCNTIVDESTTSALSGSVVFLYISQVNTVNLNTPSTSFNLPSTSGYESKAITMTVRVKQHSTLSCNISSWNVHNSEIIIWDGGGIAPQPSMAQNSVTIYQLTWVGPDNTWYGSVIWSQN